MSGPDQRRSAIRGILFDKDGTLLDFHATWTPLNRAAAEMAAGGDAALAARLLELGGYDAASGRTRSGSLLAAGSAREIAAAWADAGAAEPAEALEHDIDRVFAEAAETAVPTADLADLFAGLRGRGLALGLATTDSEAGARAFLAHHGVEHEFAFICGYDSGYGVKPDPAIVEAFANMTGLAPAEIAVVGDNPHDTGMGRAAGAGLVVGVLTGTSSREDFGTVPDAVIESIADLPVLLGDLPSPAQG